MFKIIRKSYFRYSGIRILLFKTNREKECWSYSCIRHDQLIVQNGFNSRREVKEAARSDIRVFYHWVHKSFPGGNINPTLYNYY